MKKRWHEEMDERRSVIVVDNEETILSLIREIFTSHGYHCETAPSAVIALELLSRRNFDVMVTDIVMPGMDGIELTKAAKSIRPDIAVIVMTGFVEDFTYDEAFEAGAADFIKKPFTEKEILMRAMKVQQQERLLAMSITDELTGIHNRRGFFAFAERLLMIARRQKKGLFMLYADLDHLKETNDTLGHREGDRALVDFAHVLKATCRESDIVSRIGGDEFAVIPIGTTRESVEAIITRLEKSIENHNATGKRSYRLSISFGVSYYDPEDPCSVDALIAQADRMMYQQKRLKRNLS
ncbi:MAG TPA: diguanylate cyclase [Thermodesulfovibrionales bacterium]|nr:diguanylate cyclase [Thermodesulfovibrionales bacterium]